MSELKPCPFCGESKLLYSGGCGFRYDDDDNQIRLFRVHCRTCKGRTGLFESLDEAVEAWNRRTNSTTIQPPAELSTNLAEVGTDAISRDDVLRIVDYYGQWNDYHGREREAIEQLPPIQPKRGKWIKTARWGRVYYCNQCRNYLDFDGVNAGRGSANFCPNCGADMRGEQDE